MQTWKDDEFLLGFKFSRFHTSRKGFHELFEWNFWTSGGVTFEQFMGDFTYRDSATRQVQLFISFVNFRATRPACSISYIIVVSHDQDRKNENTPKFPSNKI